MIWGGIRQSLTFPLASRAARLRIADCLPWDYNIPRNSFNSLADLHEIWHTWHRWADSIAHQFWVEYDNSEFSVPSMGMFNDFKLFIYIYMSNVSVGHLHCVYKSILHKVTAPYYLVKVILPTKFQPNRFGNKKLTRVFKLSLNRMCRIAQPLRVTELNQSHTYYFQHIHLIFSRLGLTDMAIRSSEFDEYLTMLSMVIS